MLKIKLWNDVMTKQCQNKVFLKQYNNHILFMFAASFYKYCPVLKQYFNKKKTLKLKNFLSTNFSN